MFKNQYCSEESTDSISNELREWKINEFLEKKRRQQLRSNNHELRQLKVELQSALMFKQLREQQSLLKEQQKKELLKNGEEILKFAAKWAKAEKDHIEEAQQIKWKKATFRDELAKQVDELKQKRRLEIELLIEDREENKKLINRLQNEEIQECKNTKLLQERYRMELEESARKKELHKRLEMKKSNDDDECYREYQNKCYELKTKNDEEKKSFQKQKEAVSDCIGQKLSLIRNEKQERENLLLSLLLKENKAKEDERYRQNLINHIEQREQLRAEQVAYLNEIRIQKEKQFKEDEDRMREAHLLYLTERYKLTQLSDEKRRRKKLEHNRELRQMIELRRTELAKQITERINEFENLMAGEKEREKLIEEERIRMLSTAPKELLKYLPHGVLKISEKKLLALSEEQQY